MKQRWILRGLKIFIAACLFLTLFGFIVTALWNALIPDLFHGPTLTYWQALGLFVLAHFFLGGWGRMFGGRKWRREQWRERYESRLAAMTPEEREKFRAEWQHRCGTRGVKETPAA